MAKTLMKRKDMYWNNIQPALNWDISIDDSSTRFSMHLNLKKKTCIRPASDIPEMRKTMPLQRKGTDEAIRRGPKLQNFMSGQTSAEEEDPKTSPLTKKMYSKLHSLQEIG